MAKYAYIDELEEWAKSFQSKNSIRVKVRFSETDTFGHLNNTNTFVYFEEARIHLFQNLGFMQKWSLPDSDTIPVVADQQCDYLKQVYFDQRLNVYAKIHRIGRTSIDIQYMAMDEKESICFVGKSRIVMVSKETGRPIPWSADMIEKMKMMDEIPTVFLRK
ncbi:acyl-CoA thioesterase [Pseudalkalibacillus caeni]|uniref:Acyl-CoA thioesterase n=1 Tax=Exobacillus caeni TaxID=2574798 RepID=A0A5R9FAH6_9BACL|nr:thioesterase family protein [Pseudalkalibacillus caeni]TLS39196.1 acyl-CoA thioesterase [Pseudalkalibacillus caeni]